MGTDNYRAGGTNCDDFAVMGSEVNGKYYEQANG